MHALHECIARASCEQYSLMTICQLYPPPLQRHQGGEAGLLLSRGGGGRGFWTQNLVYQKWPDQIFPIVNFVFSHYGHFGLGRGGGNFGGGVPPPLVFNYSKEALGGGGAGRS